MKVAAMKIKLFGKVGTIYRVIDASGGVLHAATTEAEAKEWMAAQ